MIAIQHAESGEVEIVTSLDGYGPEWRRLPSRPRGNAGHMARLGWADGRLSEAAEAVEEALVVGIKAHAAKLSAKAVTASPAKAVAYAAKRAEVAAWAGATDEAANVPRRFPYAAADAVAHGDGPADAIARFAAGAAASDARAAAIEAVEQAGVAHVRAARSSAAKRRAAAAIDWTKAA